MAAGDLTRQIPVSGQDELARLAGTFNDMAQAQEMVVKVAGQMEQTAEGGYPWPGGVQPASYGDSPGTGYCSPGTGPHFR
ncbi:HAMP domain-containing protein [Desulfofundulus luciae]|uniref:HAMP domain-containing protein n=1 Tax=Desulfofundulus luciae TaxID=74702 RepID=UPI0027D84049|nr:HAMP domain-containing protein [Desulfofundulus luciae]